MNINNELYLQLVNCNWLKNCGKNNDFNYGFKISLLKNKESMIENISSIKWENICLEERGNFTAYLSRNYQDEYNHFWNKETTTIKKDLFPLIFKDLNKIIETMEYPSIILDDIKFNVLTILMTSFYSQFYKSTFYNNLLEIYLSGYLPCGWCGQYPDGKISVY